MTAVTVHALAAKSKNKYARGPWSFGCCTRPNTGSAFGASQASRNLVIRTVRNASVLACESAFLTSCTLAALHEILGTGAGAERAA